MRQQRSDNRTFSPELAHREGAMTVEQALALRADQARRAAHYADRVEQAQAAAQYGAMRHWVNEYRYAAMQCRLLGELIRTEHSNSVAAAAAKHDPALAPLAPPRAIDILPAGEAA